MIRLKIDERWHLSSKRGSTHYMWFIAIYLLVAAIGAWAASLWLNKTNSHAWSGLTFVRSGLVCSGLLLAIDALIFLIVGFWPIHPLMVIVFGLGMPIIMTAII